MNAWMETLRSLWMKLGYPGEFFISGAIGKEKALPAVTYRTLERIRDTALDGEKKYRSEGTFPHPQLPGEFIEQRSKQFIARIEFRIESRSATQAEQLMENLENILEDYADVLGKQGVMHIKFVKELESEVMREGADSTAIRKVIFDFRYKVVRHVNVSDIEAAYVSARV
ncbi:hypothetical protein C0431_13255 [bacterium]|nr:hypothetical protein [bacterium]